MFKKLFLGCLVLLVFALVGATVYFNMIDWNEHKSLIAKQFSDATGKEVSFNGTVSFNIFPTPSLEASDIEVYNAGENGAKVNLANIQKMVATLSIRSLMQGRLNVETMTVINPEIYIEAYSDGRLNWQSNTGTAQDFSINNIEMSFGSVTLENAKVHLINKLYGVNTLIENINAEVISESLFGPYRIEGSYVKDGTPGGFALDFGQFSESFATSVSAVINHLQSESYVRFDGTVLLKNDAVNGTITVESKNPVNFINSMFKGMKISEDYEYPLAMSLAIKSDKSQIVLSNMVIKYAGSAGAGNIFIPRRESKIGESGMERRRIDVDFNMAELNLDVPLTLLQEFLHKYDGGEYVPDSSFDVVADLKAVKTMYNEQVIRDLSISVDFMDNAITLQNCSAQLPFDGTFKAKGEVYGVEKVLTYNFDVDAATTNFARVVQWLGYDLKPLNAGTYKRASAKFTFSGTPQTLKLAPFVFNIDKTGINGKLALVRGAQNKYFAIIEADNINFDNYIAEENPEAGFKDKIIAHFKNLKDLNAVDLQFRLNLGSGIKSKIPFEKLAFEGSLKDGIMKITDLSIGDVATSQIALKGEVSGFGNEPALKNVKYGIDVKDSSAFAEKMGIDAEPFNLNNLVQFSSNGVITGGFNRFAIKNNSKLGNIEASYSGEVADNNGFYNLNGKAGLKNNDFVRMLNDMNIRYNPEYPLGLIRLNADIKGSVHAFLLKKMDLNIGSNHFVGDVLYSDQNGRNLIKADLSINKFEFERFFYNTNTRTEPSNFRSKSERVPFLARPILSKAKINYDWSKDLDIEAKIKTDALSLHNYGFTNARWVMSLNKQLLKVMNFSADKDDGIIDANWELNIAQNAKLKGTAKLQNFKVNKDSWSGLIYGLQSGVLNTEITFDTSLETIDDMFTSFSGKGNFKIDKPVVKGINLSVIEADLENRTIAEGLKSIVQENLSGGSTAFNRLSGDFSVDNGQYVINNTLLDGDTYMLEANANGNFGAWSINSSFHTAFKNIENVGEFDFSLDGTLNAPTLETDIEPIAAYYLEQQQKIAAELQAANDARIQKYRALMEEQQERAHLLKDDLQDNVMQEFKLKSDLCDDEAILKKYSAVNNRIIKSNSLLNDVFAKKDMMDITDDIIAELKAQNDDVSQRLKDIRKDIAKIHAEDVRLRLENAYKSIAALADKPQQIYSRMLEENGKFGERLAAINTQYSSEKDVYARNLKDKIERLTNEVDGAIRQAVRDHGVTEEVDDVEILENYTADFIKIHTGAVERLDAAEAALEEYVRHVGKQVETSEEAYQQWLHDEAIRQKLDENTGSITTDNGKTVKVERNLDEIRRSEAIIRKQGDRVLDFGKKAKTSSQEGLVVKVKDNEVIESGGRILK
ncbi:MAG: AsmA family protein [Alphaproteobacteria bacterium]|nr:AsmA family protein [Alphaproteobacteria bacterium]